MLSLLEQLSYGVASHTGKRGEYGVASKMAGYGRLLVGGARVRAAAAERGKCPPAYGPFSRYVGHSVEEVGKGLVVVRVAGELRHR